MNFPIPPDFLLFCSGNFFFFSFPISTSIPASGFAAATSFGDETVMMITGNDDDDV